MDFSTVSRQELIARIAELESLSKDGNSHEELLKDLALQAAGTGAIEWNPEQDQIVLSAQAKKLWGIEHDRAPLETILKTINVEDRTHVVAELRRSASEAADYDLEFRVGWPDGSEHWLRSKGGAVAVAGLRILRGIVLDIEPRKQMEQRIERLLVEKEAMLESAGDGIYGLDLMGRCTFINGRAARMLGYKKEEFLGREMHELIHYKRADGTLYTAEQCPICRTSRTGKGTRVDDEVVWRRDGTAIPVEYSAQPIVVKGRIEGTVVTMNDITERSKGERALRESEERFRSLVEATAAMVWSTPASGEFETPQPEWSAVTGQSWEELRGWGWLAAIHPDDRVRTAELWSSAIASRSLYQVEHRLRRSDGSYRYMQARAVPILDSGSGRIREWVGAHTDVTAQHEAREQLEEAKAAAEEANRAKSQFLAAMSHELRTPLNAIIGYSEMLQEETEELGIRELKPDLEKINTAGKHLLALINEVLDLSKIEAGKMELFVETFNLDEMIEEVKATIEPLIKKNGNNLKAEHSKSLGTMRSDLTKLRQSLFNLLSNAAKFTTHGTIELDVQLERQENRDWVLFRVRDSGIGMSPEQVEKLFEPFSQADRTTARKYGGTGLGLAITRRFCEMMGGTVEVQSTQGAGSTFTLRLPQNIQAPAVQEGKRTESGATSTRRFTKGKALIIDDDNVARDLMRRHLAREGFEPVLAGGGEEGLRLAREIRPKLITLDVMMPGMDGWAVLQALKADPELAQIPVIMATIVENKNLGYLLGATDYLVKPIHRDQLSHILKRFECVPRPCTVLLVEDEADNRRLLRTMLERESWIVIEAEDGVAGLARLAEKEVQLILLDLVMPNMNGFEFVAEIRKHPEFRSIPIVVLTAKDLTAEDKLLLNGYVEHILSKSSYTREELLSDLREFARTTARVSSDYAV